MTSIHWFRRDLRLEENPALCRALQSGSEVQCIFIFDTEILNKLPEKDDARVSFIHQSLENLNTSLQQYGSTLKVYIGKPLELWPKILKEESAQAVYCNRDYEPYGMERDNQVAAICGESGVAFHSFKECVIFEKDEVVKDDGSPYTVFTPYSKKWKEALRNKGFQVLEPFEPKAFKKTAFKTIPTLSEIGFESSSISIPSKSIPENIIAHYDQTRNFPGMHGTSKLSIHLRFGTISIISLAKQAMTLNEIFLNELIWREFYQMILWHFPQVVGHAFKPAYEAVPWRADEEGFQAWCEGKTGYPIVDAGMRELNATGLMHNRSRMITASFLTKHLLIDWRLGEAYFAQKLLDFELASNNGGWQWAAGCGTDAAPYFRIFNPAEQTRRFDADFSYIKKWVPEWQELSYPKPIVEHKFARERCLNAYKAALKS
jgi:deoxyribodipyrimidine photo-lyase